MHLFTSLIFYTMDTPKRRRGRPYAGGRTSSTHRIPNQYDPKLLIEFYDYVLPLVRQARSELKNTRDYTKLAQFLSQVPFE